MKFEWDERKNYLNILKHGISFENAKAVFAGFTVDILDDRFDYGETRKISIGTLAGVAILAVVHTDREGTCRIISARKANRKERKKYEEEIQSTFDT